MKRKLKHSLTYKNRDGKLHVNRKMIFFIRNHSHTSYHVAVYMLEKLYKLLVWYFFELIRSFLGILVKQVLKAQTDLQSSHADKRQEF